MPQGNWIVFMHFIAVWLSVVISLMARWSMSVKVYVLLPLGIMTWALGFLLNMHLLRSSRERPALYQAAQLRRIYLRITARTIMNVGIALAFRSWFTLLVTGILIPFYVSAGKARRVYLD